MQPLVITLSKEQLISARSKRLISWIINNKVSFAQLINFFSGFLLSSKTTIFQIGNFLSLNHYTEDDTLTSTLQQVLRLVWKGCINPLPKGTFSKVCCPLFFQGIYFPCNFPFHFLTRPFWFQIFFVSNDYFVTRTTYLALTLPKFGFKERHSS